jgi:hypothetical protein
MSGLLERMILRTRSGLAGIEPLSAPRYTATAGSREPEDRLDAAQSVIRALPPPQPRARLPRTVQTLPRNRAAPAEAAHSAATRRDQIVDKLSVDDATHATPQDASNARHLAARNEDLGAHELHLPLTPAETAFGEDTAPAAIGKQRATPSAVAPGRTALAAGGVTPAALPQHARSRPVEQALFAANSGAPAAPPHITISIGHVEVRATPVSQPLRRPTFRPRVTLDEYLRRTGDTR